MRIQWKAWNFKKIPSIEAEIQGEVTREAHYILFPPCVLLFSAADITFPFYQGGYYCDYCPLYRDRCL
jgi:hypothetical protein